MMKPSVTSILFIIDSLCCGGAEKSLISLLPLIDYERYEVDLLIFNRGGVFEKYVPQQVNIIEGYEIYADRRMDRVRKSICQAYFSLQVRLNSSRHGAEKHWRAMNSVIKPLAGEYDVAIAYQQGLPTFFLATKVNAGKKISWINADVYAVGYDMDYCKQFYDKLDTVVAVSETLKDKLMSQSPWMKNKVTCIYDIVNPEVIRRLSKETVNDMPSQQKSLSIVTVGRLTKPKNHLMAVKAAALLKSRQVDFKWYFVGEGEMRPSIEKAIVAEGLQGQVILLGLKENPYPYMALADIYVQTSSFEGFGLTIAEAKILRKPVVSTNFDVVYDQIADGQNGLIAEMTPDSVADKIMELLQDEELRSRIIRNLEQEINITAISEVRKFHEMISDE